MSVLVEVEQRSDEWQKLRCGVATASCFDRIITPATGKPSASAVAYRRELLAEWLTGQPVSVKESGWMQRGTEMEPEARAFYEFEADAEVTETGFVYLDERRLIGCSPDGLVGDDGLVEIKCPAPHTHVGYLIDSRLPTAYIPQVQGALWATGRYRVAVHSELSENPYIVENDPEYIQNLMQLDGPKREAWLHGNWDIVAGGMFDDVWDPSVHVVKPFAVPEGWYVDRSFDWGSSRPYSVGWWAESDGTEISLPGGRTMATRPGDLFRIAELYGWTGKPNQGTRELAVEVARKIQAVESQLELSVNPGPADPSIYTEQDGECIATNMERVGVSWRHCSFGSRSRENGWEIMRTMLKNAKGSEGPRLFVFETCRQFIRTVPVLPRDEVKMDDVDTTAEDHVADETRYRILSHKVVSSITQF